MSIGEWDKRQLCPDGGCVGVIGPSGTCKVCGRAAPNWGDERKRGLITNPGQDNEEDDEDEDLDDEADDEEDEDGDGDAEAEADDEIAPGTPATMGNKVPSWSKRRLCPDGACIGVIGKNGVCNVCGKSAEPEKAAAVRNGKRKPVADAEDEDEDAADDDDADDADADGDDADDADGDSGDDDNDDDRASVKRKADDDDDDDDDDDSDDSDDSDDGDDGDDDDDDDADHDDERRAAASDDDEVDEDGLRASDTRPAYSEELDDRQLCSDGGCVGVIGKNGRCKVCGKAAA